MSISSGFVRRGEPRAGGEVVARVVEGLNLVADARDDDPVLEDLDARGPGLHLPHDRAHRTYVWGMPPTKSEVVVTGSGAGVAQAITAGEHHLVSDEPEASGGTDMGPGPYDLLLAALGSCTSTTMAMYARRKRWPLETVRVRLRHSKVHAQDCVDCETQPAKLDRIERDIELVGALDDEQRARLLEIADRCPVHRTLTSHIDIQTRLVGMGA